MKGKYLNREEREKRRTVNLERRKENLQMNYNI